MVKRSTIIISVTAGVVIAGGLAVLIWWLVAGRDPFTVVVLDEPALGDVDSTAALTRIRGYGDMFWWFFPSQNDTRTSRPIILWLDGVTGVAPSLLANFGMFGPYDFNLNRRQTSWVDQYNLLFVDAPIGTGFSAARSDSAVPQSMDDNTGVRDENIKQTIEKLVKELKMDIDNKESESSYLAKISTMTVDHLMFTLESFYAQHSDYQDAPLYIFGQGHGAQLALALTLRLLEEELPFSHNLEGIVLCNGIISPAVALKKLSFYLWELGYVEENGRGAIETFSEETNDLVDNGQLAAAFDHFLLLGEYTNGNAGATAVNLGHIVEKLARDAPQDNFGQPGYINNVFGIDSHRFMDETVAPALGITGGSFDARHSAAVQAFRNSFMESDVDKVEHILQNTDLKVTIINGNLDAVSNTPGQLEWVNSLQWPGQQAFLSSPRSTFIVNGLVQGYFRETQRFAFYWVNAAGQSVPLDSPDAMRRIVDRITAN